MNSRISITFNQYPCVAGLLAAWCMCQRLSLTEIWFLRSVNSNKNSIFFSHRRTRLIEPPPHSTLPQFPPKSFPACYENIFSVFDSFAGLRRAYSEKIWFFFIVRRCVCRNRRGRKANVCCCFSGGTETKADDSRENNDMQKYRIKNQFIVESLCCHHTLSGPTFHFYFLSLDRKGLGRTDPTERVEYLSLMVFYFSPSFFHLHRLRYCSLFSGLLSKLIYGHEFN